MDTNFLTTHEIASITDTNKVHIDRLIVNEGIPFHRYHHRVVVKVSDLVVFLARKLSSEEPIAPTDSAPPKINKLRIGSNRDRSPP